jgi:hypothetical protein
MELLLTKIIIFAMCFCILNLIREAYTFYQCFSKMEEYKISNGRMLALWVSISFILTIIFTGF